MKKSYHVIFTLILSLLILSAAAVIQAPNGPLTPQEELGKNLFFDKISSPDWMSCATCHGPEVGFTGPNPGINKKGAVYRGAVPKRFGNRKPPSAAYATLSPVFHYDDDKELFIGGNFWDGRATGEVLGNPAADQALGPFLNPVEQNNASKKDVLEQIAASKYAWLWEVVHGDPISVETEAEVEANYDLVGLAIAAYEGSSEVNSFSSKFDYFMAGDAELTLLELQGMELFNGVAECSACHPAPLFTDYTYDNVGAPRNPDNPFYKMDEVFLDDGSPINPLGDAWIDKGLGGFLEFHGDPGWRAMSAENMGKQKVPTLRNVGKRPGNNFPKAYLHNGVFKSLEEVVHFYNTRDVETWPPPEVAENINADELGDLGLSAQEETAVVAFLNTLSDGYDVEKGKNKARQASTKQRHGRAVSLDISGPNPFNPSTHLTYQLPEEGQVYVAVFNMNGQQVAVLDHGQKPAGTYSVLFDAQGLPSGTYLIRLTTGSEVVTQKVLLLK